MLISYLVILFLSSCLISVFYWNVIQPVALRAVRFRLFARRDQLRRLAVEKEVNSGSWAYRELEGFICKTIGVVPACGLTSFVWFAFKSENERSYEYDRFRKEASPELVKLMVKTVEDAFLILFFNSPFITIVFIAISFLLWVIDRINRITIYRKAEDFIDSLPSDNSIATPQAA